MAPNGEMRLEGKGAGAALPLSHPGLNVASTPSKELYLAARRDVVERQAEAPARAARAGPAPRLVKHLHYIRGKAYDLRPFYEQHPGGADILRMSAGIVDATPLFESYHAFANLPSIMSQLAKYEVAAEQSPEAMYSFEQDGFYATLTRRVRAHFGAESAKQSVTPAVKADWAWAVKVGAQVLLNCFFYYQAFVRTDLPTPVAALCAVLSGLLLICWGFCAMHDASHFALGARNHWANTLVTRVWTAIALWSCRVWMFHHAVLHHSFTGSAELDPDVSHALPLVRKHPDTPRSQAFALFRWLGDTFGMAGWTLACGLLYVLSPGMWLGQVLQYFQYRVALNEDWATKWNMPKLATVVGYETRWWENALYAAQLIVQYRRGNIYVTLAYVIALNFFYSMAIVADHDLVESAITNHLDVDLPQAQQLQQQQQGERADGADGAMPAPQAVKPDWGEVQVRNSTDFVNDRYNLFAHAFGSINYQTVHHLFPGVSHTHLPSIAPIVQQTCEEFGVPYTVYPSLFDAWHSFVLVVRATMTGREDELRPKAKAE